MVAFLGLPDGFTNQSWALNPLAWWYRKQVTIELKDNPVGLIIKTRGHSAQEAKGLTASVERAYRRYYAKQRLLMLQQAKTQLVQAMANNNDRLTKIVMSLENYKTDEQIFVVNASLKDNLDKVLNEQGFRIGQSLANLKNESALIGSLNLKMLPEEIGRALKIKMLQLTDMELKKVLIPPEALASFNGGISQLKNQIAGMVNQGIANNAEANIAIKAIFLQAKYEALDALLHRRYGQANAFTGRLGEYAGLKVELDKRAIDQERFIWQLAQLNKMMASDLSQEIVVDVPIIVAKK